MNDNVRAFPEVIALLENCSDGNDLIRSIDLVDNPKNFTNIKEKFNIEYVEFMKSRLIANSNNERSLEYYQDRELEFRKMRKIIKEAESILKDKMI